jgi:hypothetical protein
MELVQDTWNRPANKADAAAILTEKFKSLRYALRKWSKSLSNLKGLIANCNTVVFFLDTLEETRPLFNPEVNLRNIIKVQLATLLRYRKEYWRKQYTVNRICFGDECTKFFHAMGTVHTDATASLNYSMIRKHGSRTMKARQVLYGTPLRLGWVSPHGRLCFST